MLVRIRNYRCVRDVGVELGGGLAVLLGPNGSGETSFLEALCLGASGGSATPLGWPKAALAWVIAGRGKPYSPALVNASAYIEVDGRGVVAVRRGA